MARKKAHEDHVNHEAWAIPYGDMLVLLLALFVVMYAVSSVNEGKYRVLADTLQAEFSGAPRTLTPIQFGEKQKGSEPDSQSSMIRQRAAQTAGGPVSQKLDVAQMIQTRLPMPLRAASTPAVGRAQTERVALEKMGHDIEDALGDLVRRKLVRVRSSDQALEVEIRADILFPSGSAALSAEATPVLSSVSKILAGYPNAMRVEGHTDSMPISTQVYPSNWELSAARAASVLHLFVHDGIDPHRLSVAGFGEFRPAGDNATLEGRNRNRRVVIVVLAREAGGLPPAIGSMTSKPDKPASAAQGNNLNSTSVSAKSSPRPAAASPDQTAQLAGPPSHH